MTAHTHDPQAVERIAEALRSEIWDGWMNDPKGEITRAEQMEGIVVFPRDLERMAVAALDAVETLYETEAGE